MNSTCTVMIYKSNDENIEGRGITVLGLVEQHSVAAFVYTDSFIFVTLKYIPVSYTHLDVYKRQL